MQLEVVLDFPSSQVSSRVYLQCRQTHVSFQQHCNRLNKDKRPELITLWMGAGRRYDRGGKFPTRARATAHAASLVAWWFDLQPAWRKPRGTFPMVRSGPADSWNSLCRGGSNGIFLFIVALSWLPPKCPFNDPAVADLLDDVAWAMRRMVEISGGDDEDIFTRTNASAKTASSSKRPTVTVDEDNMDVDEDNDAHPVQKVPKPARKRVADTRPAPRASPRKRKAKDSISLPAKKQKGNGSRA